MPVIVAQQDRHRKSGEVGVLPMSMMDGETTAPNFLKFPFEILALMNNRVTLPIHLHQSVQNHFFSRTAGIRQDAYSRRGMQNRHSITATKTLNG